MFDTTITWGDLFSVVLFILGIGVLFYLLLAIANLVGILKNLRSTLDRNKDNINNTLEKLPEITDNVEKITEILKDEMESIQKVIGTLGKISDSAKDTVEVFRKDILVKAKSIVDIIDWIKKLFEKDKKKNDKEIIYKYRYTPKEEVVEQEVTRQSSNYNNDSSDKTCGNVDNGGSDGNGSTLNNNSSDNDDSNAGNNTSVKIDKQVEVKNEIKEEANEDTNNTEYAMGKDGFEDESGEGEKTQPGEN